jgi:hypothetical protein
MTRSTEEVFEDHLRLRLAGKLEEDLQRNYASDIVLLTCNSNRTGHAAMRVSAARLKEQLPDAEFTFLAKQVKIAMRFLSGMRHPTGSTLSKAPTVS